MGVSLGMGFESICWLRNGHWGAFRFALLLLLLFRWRSAGCMPCNRPSKLTPKKMVSCQNQMTDWLKNI